MSSWVSMSLFQIWNICLKIATVLQVSFLTHGHADAIGALPYLLSEVKVPVFGSELTIELAKLFVKGNDSAKKFDDFHVIDENTEIDFWRYGGFLLPHNSLYPRESGCGLEDS